MCQSIQNIKSKKYPAICRVDSQPPRANHIISFAHIPLFVLTVHEQQLLRKHEWTHCVKSTCVICIKLLEHVIGLH